MADVRQDLVVREVLTNSPAMDQLSDGQNTSVREWLSRFRYLILVFGVLLLESFLVNSQLHFIKTTWFARQYVESGVHINCNDTPDSLPCQQGVADVAYWSGTLNGLSGFVGIFSALALGSLSDTVGRWKVVAAKTLLGFIVACTLVAVVFLDLSLWVYLFMEAVESCLDTKAVWLAMVADLTRGPGDQKQRGAIFGSSTLIFFMFGCVFFPLCAMLSYTQAVAGAAMMSFLSLCLVVFMLPETKPVASEIQKHSGLGALCLELRQALDILNRNSFMQCMVCVLALGGVSFAAKTTILKPYMMAEFGMNKTDFAMILPCAAPSIILCFTIGLWKLAPRMGEVNMLRCSFFANSMMTLAIVLSRTKEHLYVIYGFLLGPGLVFLPLCNAIKSNLCTDQEQGKVQGLIAAVRGLSVSVADIAFGALYSWTTDGGKDTAAARSILFLVFGLTVAAAMLTLALPQTYPKQQQQSDDVEVASSGNSKDCASSPNAVKNFVDPAIISVAD